MNKKLLVERKTLEKAKTRLDAQLVMMDDPEFRSAIPLHKKLIAKIERKALKRLIKELGELLE